MDVFCKIFKTYCSRGFAMKIVAVNTLEFYSFAVNFENLTVN